MGHHITMRTHSLVFCLLAALQYVSSDTREGQTLSPSFTCGKYTTRTVLIGSSTTSVIKSDRGTMRCTVLFKLSDCKEMKMTCQKFYVDNRDPYKCKRGDTFNVKAKGGKPMSYCKRNKPNERYPAVSTGNMKVWYTAMGGKRYPKKGFSCTTVCSHMCRTVRVTVSISIQGTRHH